MVKRIVDKIWLNGKLIPYDQAKIHVLSHGLHYGTGVFEGIRAYKTNKGPAVFRLPEHIKRFFNSAAYLNLKIPFSRTQIKKAILETIRANKLSECYIRPIAFAGEGQMGLKFKNLAVEVAIACWPWGAYLGKGKPIKVKISRYIRLHPSSVVPEAKVCGYYTNSVLASLEAQKEKVDEVLLLDYRGYVAEGPGENIFMVKSKRLITPSLGSILPGITRQSVIEMAADLGILVEEKNITPSELMKADELFFTGTAVEIQPIGQIEGVLINQGRIGALTQKIKDLYQKIVHGQEKKYSSWLTWAKR